MSLIDVVHSFSKYLPKIKPPEKPLGIKEKLLWTGLVLVLYFMMYQTTAFGVQQVSGGLDFLQTITASRIGSLLTTGIGPIVLSSIFLQLFSGAGIIDLNMRDKKDKAKFLEVQKVLAITLALVEAIVFVAVTQIVPVASIPGFSPVLLTLLVIFQITMGSVVMVFLDELVTKYGIGSGISLFIAAGVSLSIFMGVVNLVFNSSTGFLAIMAEGGAEAIPNALFTLLPFGFTILVFMAVVYAEAVKVEIPIAFQRVRGMVPKLPLKFFYVSNIPVIFASALIINIQLFSGGMLSGFYFDEQKAPLMDFSAGYDIGKHGIIPLIGYVDSTGRLSDGLLYLFTPVYGMGRTTTEHWNFLSNASTPIFGIPEWTHSVVYVILLSLVSVLFGMFWVETANMDAKSVAGQLSESGIQIPGFRRDPRMLESILHKHILPLTFMGSFSVGLLAGIADLTGALGTGTGILLTVGILYRMYEQLEQMRTFEMYPSISGFLGGE
ncbi:preprotein translocase subunit SecY [Candidatus Micrarchaeota archaeon]|nr:preprotein translocase subunit SecY [Candidatus Micrarchaeota archaeon]